MRAFPTGLSRLSQPSPYLLIITVTSTLQLLLTDGRSACGHVLSVEQRGGRELRGAAVFPRLSEREHFSGQACDEARHLFLPSELPFGLEAVGHPVGEAGHQARQLQVTVAVLL